MIEMSSTVIKYSLLHNHPYSYQVVLETHDYVEAARCSATIAITSSPQLGLRTCK